MGKMTKIKNKVKEIFSKKQKKGYACIFSSKIVIFKKIIRW